MMRATVIKSLQIPPCFFSLLGMNWHFYHLSQGRRRSSNNFPLYLCPAPLSAIFDVGHEPAPTVVPITHGHTHSHTALNTKHTTHTHTHSPPHTTHIPHSHTPHLTPIIPYTHTTCIYSNPAHSHHFHTDSHHLYPLTLTHPAHSHHTFTH